MASGNITLSKPRCQEILERCVANATATDGSQKQWGMLAERFSYLLTK